MTVEKAQKNDDKIGDRNYLNYYKKMTRKEVIWVAGGQWRENVIEAERCETLKE